MARRVPEGPPPPPVVTRIRLRYAKRDRLRFTSHRDFARAFERALRRAEIPMGYSAGFSPHPKISYIGAAPTGVASEAEYVEIGLATDMEPETVRERLDAALPPGLDVVEAVRSGGGTLADRMEASDWRVELPGVTPDEAARAVQTFLARDVIEVQRHTKNGLRTLDARGPVLRFEVLDVPAAGPSDDLSRPVDGRLPDVRAIMTLVVRQVTPTVRPDDVVAALHDVAGLAPVGAARALRLAQGPVDAAGVIGDPLAADRERATTP